MTKKASNLYLGSEGQKRVGQSLYAGAFGGYELGSIYASGKLFGMGEVFLGRKCEGAAFGQISDGAADDAAGLTHTRVLGTDQPLFVTTSANGGALRSSATIVSDSSGYDHGSLYLNTAGTDATACVAGFNQTDSAGNANEWIRPLSDGTYIASFALTEHTGILVPAAGGLMQFGFCGGVQAAFQTDIAGAFATDAVYAQIEANKVYLVVKAGATTTKSTDFIDFSSNDASMNLHVKIRGNGNGKFIANLTNGTRTLSIRFTDNSGITQNMQVFGRVGHTGAYAAAVGDKVSAKLDMLAVNLDKGIV